jgi:hypothetical protein
MKTLEESNDLLRTAVRTRLDATPADDPKMVGYKPPILAGCEPAQQCAADLLSRASSCCEGQQQHVTLGYDTKTMKDAKDYLDATNESQEHYQAWKGDGLLSETYAEWEPGFQQVSPAEQTLRDAIATIRDRHDKYGPPREHFQRTASLVNAAFGTTFTAADWALVMVLDKIARQMGTAATDDAAIDIAGYAACHQECRRA